MIVPDSNLLLYAYDSASQFHDRSAEWKACLEGMEPVGLCAAVLFAFIRISTSRHVYREPLSINEANERVRSRLDREVTDFLLTQESDVCQAMQWLQAAGSGGRLTTDAQIAAVAHRYRGTVHTADTDFSRFPDVHWLNPLL